MKINRWLPICSALIATLAFVAVVVFFSYRDIQAVDRCEAMGGQTWDSGQHCAIGIDHVVNTHNRIWG